MPVVASLSRQQSPVGPVDPRSVDLDSPVAFAVYHRTDSVRVSPGERSQLRCPLQRACKRLRIVKPQDRFVHLRRSRMDNGKPRKNESQAPYEQNRRPVRSRASRPADRNRCRRRDHSSVVVAAAGAATGVVAADVVAASVVVRFRPKSTASLLLHGEPPRSHCNRECRYFQSIRPPHQ